jgi:probable DNA metabolism protein
MRNVILTSLNDMDEWRGAARALLVEGVPPSEVAWSDPANPQGLFAEDETPVARIKQPVGSVPAAFMSMAADAICNSDPERFALLYRLLWRLQSQKGLLEILSDPDVLRLTRMGGAVRRDSHKMTAFVRFKFITDEDGAERALAWFEPDHYILERTAPFFMRRYTGMNWAIITPYRSVVWDQQALVFGEGGRKADVPAADALDDVWRTYYASIFNPARLKVSMMKSEMPMKYWRNLPEAELIAPLIAGAKQAEEAMIARNASQPPSRHLRQQARQADMPTEPAESFATLEQARAAVNSCRRCPLYENATQAVFGEGPEHADIMFVGEQPGDQEDLAGMPFIGPAGKVFDAAVAVAGIDRSRVYVTNAVKHFKFEPRGKRRIHMKPNAGEIEACRFWVNLEREFVQPRIVVALGATAATSILGRQATISGTRGEPIQLEDGSWLFVTVHPSYLLRLPDRSQADIEREKFENDLVRVRQFAGELDKAGGERRAVH